MLSAGGDTVASMTRSPSSKRVRSMTGAVAKSACGPGCCSQQIAQHVERLGRNELATDLVSRKLARFEKHNFGAEARSRDGCRRTRRAAADYRDIELGRLAIHALPHQHSHTVQKCRYLDTLRRQLSQQDLISSGV